MDTNETKGMPVDEALELADLWAQNLTPGVTGGWRAACKTLADEVRRLRAERDQEPIGYVSQQAVRFNFGVSGTTVEAFRSADDLLDEYPEALPMAIYASPVPVAPSVPDLMEILVSMNHMGGDERGGYCICPRNDGSAPDNKHASICAAVRAAIRAAAKPEGA